MKKQLILLVTLMVLLAQNSALANEGIAKAGLLPNVVALENFENGGNFSGCNATATVVDTTALDNTPTKALQITQTGDFGYIKVISPEKISTNNGSTLRMSAKVKVLCDAQNPNNTDVGGGVMFHFRHKYDSLNPIKGKEVFAKDGWTEISADFTYEHGAYVCYPGIADDGLSIYMNPSRTTNKFVFLIDDVKIDNLGLVDSGKTILNSDKNGDFEKGTVSPFGANNDSHMSVSLVDKNVSGTQNIANGNYALRATQKSQWGLVGISLWDPNNGNMFSSGNTYEISVNVKILPNSDNSEKKGFFTVKMPDSNAGSYNGKELNYYLSSNDGFRNIKYSIVAGSGVDFSYLLLGMNQNLNNAQIYDIIIDDFVVSKVSATKIISSTPENNTISKINNNIIFKTNNQINVNDFSKENILISGASDNVDSISLQPDGSFLVKFISDLDGNKDYVLDIVNAKDIFGRPFAESIAFKTKGVVFQPTISKSIPSNYSINVPTDTKMIVEFDEEIDFSTATINNITVNGQSNLISNIATDPLKPTQIEITFNGLQNATGYIVNFKNISHKTQNVIMKEDNLCFYTVESNVISSDINGNFENGANQFAGENITSQIVDVNGNKALNVHQNQGWANFRTNKLNFEKGLYKISFDIKTLKKFNGSGEQAFGENEKVWMITNLIYNGASHSNYNAIFNDNKFNNITIMVDVPGRIDDLTFSAMKPDVWDGSYWYEFLADNIVVEKMQPTQLIDISTPKNNSLNVPLDSNITLVFNNNLKAVPDKSNIKVFCNNYEITNFSISKLNENLNLFRLNLDSGLINDAKYKVTVTNVKDSQDVTLPDQILNFTTQELYTTKGFKLYKDYQTSKIDITNGNLEIGEITAVVEELTNNSKLSSEPILIIALYENNKMIDTALTKRIVGVKETIQTPISVKLNVTEFKQGKNYQIKAFLLDNASNIRPVLENIKAVKQ